MLDSLSIQNIVLIDKLNIEFADGLSALTGETGAGKSILLDSLGLALGARGDASLVRHGVEKGQVTASFNLPASHSTFGLLDDNDISHDGEMILKRVQNADGRSKAFINDQVVSTRLLKQVGELLIEIHGQHDNRALADTSAYLSLLDAFAGLSEEAKTINKLWDIWQSARTEVAAHEENLRKAQADEDYTRHVLAELEQLKPSTEEEQALADERSILQASEKVASDVQSAKKLLHKDGGVEKRIYSAMSALERNDADIEALVKPSVEALDRALIELQLASEEIAELERNLEFDPARLDDVEERLFALRGAARKHGVLVDELPALLEKFRNMIASLEGDQVRADELYKAMNAAKAEYEQAAKIQSQKRQSAAKVLEKAVTSELPPLKLERAKFYCKVKNLSVDGAMRSGFDAVSFEVMTNPGTASGPLMKVASGGELARIMLSLKVSLADKGSAPTLVFDEIDTGVGGAVAEAIGTRLARLGDKVQVITVTHSPQVAAAADRQFVISKSEQRKNRMVTDVLLLDDAERHEEIARMLAGAVVSDEARAAAQKLLNV
ncbi:MAG: DNA repair protein RecN [Alphaproteobacteria bacterium]|nr:DNA repair protein RecN [Alphaproteobacteria bacterium]